jgi:hypothetical protein
MNITLNGTFFSLAPYTNNFEPIIKLLRLISIVTSMISLRVLLSRKLKGDTYTILGVISIGDFAYSSLMLFYSTLSYFCAGLMCNNEFNYLFLLFFIIISEYVTSCLALFNIMTETYLTYMRLKSLTNARLGNVKSKKMKTKRIILIIFTISFVVYVPVLFSYKIEDEKSSQLSYPFYVNKLSKTKFGKTKLQKAILMTLSLARIIFVTIVLLFLNMWTMINFRKYMEKKADLKSNSVNRSMIFTSTPSLKSRCRGYRFGRYKRASKLPSEPMVPL